MNIEHKLHCRVSQNAKVRNAAIENVQKLSPFVGAWKSVYKLDLLLIQDDVMVWNEPILSPVCVWYGCDLKMVFCLNLPLVFIVGCGIILVRMMCVKWL